MLFVNILLPVFLIIFAGYLLEKVAHLDFKALTFCSLYLFTPALVFSALMKQTVHFHLALNIFLFMLLYTAALLVLSVSAGRLLKMDPETRGALSLSTVMMNVGNFGLPLVYFAFGEKALNVSILTFVLFLLPLGTLGIVLAQGAKAPLGKAMLNSLKIPIFHAVILAFLLKILAIPFPQFLMRPIHLMGQGAIPLMLVLLGMQLARTKLKAAPGFLSLAAAIRLAIAPLVAWGAAELLGIRGMTRDALILQTSTPSAILPLLYSLRFGTRPDLVAGTILVTTLLSSASLTVILYLIH